MEGGVLDIPDNSPPTVHHFSCGERGVLIFGIVPCPQCIISTNREGSQGKIWDMSLSTVHYVSCGGDGELCINLG